MIRYVKHFVWMLLCLASYGAHAEISPTRIPPATPPSASTDKLPPVPKLSAKAFLLIDMQTGTILAQKNIHERVEPASLTKMMTMYIISNQLKQGHIRLSDKVRTSHAAWAIEGTRMFLREGQRATIQDLITGIIVHSANDACVSMAEHLATTQARFAELMNQEAQRLGMKNTHFHDAVGLPHPEQHTTAFDLAILARAVIQDHPEHYTWYKHKWFTFNDIKQPNRNRLLWRMPSVDGIKTGFTENAGFCLVASSNKDDTRLISITLGSPSDQKRAEDSQALLNYGHRHFQTYTLFEAKQTLAHPRLWGGQSNRIEVGLLHPVIVSIPRDHYGKLDAKLSLHHPIQAPLAAGTVVGQLQVTLLNNIIEQRDVIALNGVEQGSLSKRYTDKIRLAWSQWFGSEHAQT